jgi:hypothetical protein
MHDATRPVEFIIWGCEFPSGIRGLPPDIPDNKPLAAAIQTLHNDPRRQAAAASSDASVEKREVHGPVRVDQRTENTRTHDGKPRSNELCI